MYRFKCDHCGREFDAARPDAEVCGATCRQLRHRQRREAQRREALDLLARMASTTDEVALASLRRQAERLTRE
ncbi:hypothetical protein [Arthrobacter sp. NPDC089319]|uniref:hypothetical protein n=1 Tax=Arthrobacter sp. NPDC089319 TaxID=3155915 RepID=UPI003421A3FA